jgi:F-type H+-transporting ATPase subunit epsilon
MLIDEEVDKVTAEAENGFFCLLPRHVDFVTALVPGVLYFETAKKGEEFLAVDEGILAKVGQDVLISTRNGVLGAELETLETLVREKFEVLDDREKTSRSASAKLEADIVRRFMELGTYAR